MSVIYILAFTIILIIIVHNYHNTILVFAPLSIVFQDYMCLRYSSPAISLSFALEFIVILFAIAKKKMYLANMPIKNPVLLLFTIFIVGIISSPLPFMNTAPYVFDLVCSYLIVFIYYNEIKSKEDFMLSLKTFLITMVVLCSYSVYEFSTQTNPFIDSVLNTIPDNWGGRLYYGSSRYGAVRSQSIMNICIAWGGLCCIALSLMFYCKEKILLIIKPIFFWTLIVLLIFCILATGTRSVFVFLIFVLFGGFSSSSSNKIILFMLGIVGLFSIGGLFTEIANSMLSSDEFADGSSVGFRQMQFAAAIQAVSDNPIFGYGVKGATYASKIYEDIHGSESIWLKRLLEYGIMGVLVQLYVYFTEVKLLSRQSSLKNKSLAVCVVLGWVAFCSLTSSPGLDEPYFLVILVLLYKSNLFKYAK